MATEHDSKSSGEARRGGIGAFLAYWIPPIGIGLVVGLAIVWVWRAGGIGRTPVDDIVEHWEWGAHDANEALADRIAALGPSARRDLVDAFEAVDPDYPELKVWIAGLLTEEPFFDTKTLADAARGDDRWARRTAAVALALRLREEADPDIVMPGILDWLKDLAIDDHELPVSAVAALGPLPPEWEARSREALIELARRRAPIGDPDEDWSPEDREIVIQQGLARMIPDAAVVDVLHEVMTDEQDDFAPRVAAIRALSENRVFDRFDAWKAAAASADGVVRQAVADNLFRAQDREFGEILKPMHVDASPLVRAGSLDTQVLRRQPTMLDVLDVLLEDHDEWVRFAAAEAVAAFKDASETPRNAAMLLCLLEESDNGQDVTGALLALQAITGEVWGFREVDVHPNIQEVEQSALDAFLQDPAGRKEAAAKYRARFGGATWTKEDRIAVLERLREHADPDNRTRAEKLLSELR